MTRETSAKITIAIITSNVFSGCHGNDETALSAMTAFVTQRLAVHRPSIVALVDLSTDTEKLSRLADNDVFRDWLVSG